MRLIDADALLDSLTVDPIGCAGCPEPEFMDELIDILDTAPTVEPQGRLIGIDDAMGVADNIRDILSVEAYWAIQERIKALPTAELTIQTPQTYGKSINPSNGEVVADYISRADAIEAVGYEIDDGYNAIVDRINALPSADAVQGEWKHTITGQPYCSNCEYVFGEDEEFSPFWKHCPMCGARMKGGAE